MNNAPFKIGQKVVCIDDTPSKYGFDSPLKWWPVKGKIYTISWVGIGINTRNETNMHCSLFEDPEGDEYGFLCTKFAPIEEPKEKIRYVAVSESLREKSVEIAAIETN